jgi:glycosyltransferase involved in cell wall biosynthesis
MARTIFINRYFFPDHSATSQLLSDLAFDLARRGRDVSVITGRQLYGDPEASLPVEEVIRGVRVARVRTSRFGRANFWGRLCDYLTFYIGATWRLLWLLRPGDMVVAKTDPPMMSVCAAWVVKVKRSLLVNWIQDLFPEVATSMGVQTVRWVAPVLKRMRNWSLRQGRSNVVLGKMMAARLREEGVAPDRITIIENWADGDAIRPVRKVDNPLADEWQLNGKFVVGYSGNMGQVHEFKTVIEAADLLKTAEEIAFVFVGDGSARPWLEMKVARRGLTNVQFRPYQPADRLRWSLSVPDVHLVSLRPELEGMIVPSKFYGVAAAGRPVIYVGDPNGEIPRVLEQEGCGWSFRIGDAEPLARWILSLAHRQEEVMEAGRRGRRAFERLFSRSRALEAWGVMLDTLANPVPRSVELVTEELPAAAGKE